jgi:hypothetical protein
MFRSKVDIDRHVNEIFRKCSTPEQVIDRENSSLPVFLTWVAHGNVVKCCHAERFSYLSHKDVYKIYVG